MRGPLMTAGLLAQLLLTLLLCAPAGAEEPMLEPDLEASVEPAATAPTVATLEQVVVSGEQPGPGLWRVSRGENSLWLLGSLTPVPKRMRWKSEEVEALIASADQILEIPRVEATGDVGRIRTLFLLPSLLKARGNPDGRKLPDVLPEALYARWVPLRKKYFGRSMSVEKRRPILAASALYGKAIKRSGLDSDSPVARVVKKAAKRNRIPVLKPTIEIQIDNARDAVSEFADADLDDVRCFELTLDRLEVDLDSMRARANAWAVGDIEALRELPVVNGRGACIEALFSSTALVKLGWGDLPERIRALWLDSAEQALAEHRVTFATLPMDELLSADGYLAALQARGYEVEAPE